MPRHPTPHMIYDATSTPHDVLDEVVDALHQGAAGAVLRVAFTGDGKPVVTGRPLLRLGRSLRSVRALPAAEAEGAYPLEKIMSILSGTGEFYLETAEPERLLPHIKPSWDVYVITNAPPPRDGPRWLYRVTRPADVVKAGGADAVYFDVSGGFPTPRHVKYASSRGMKVLIGPLINYLEVKQAATLGITWVVTTAKELIAKVRAPA